MELYRKVIIKSEDDLPKEAGMYFVNVKGGVGIDIYGWYKDSDIEHWLNTFDWYLLPVEQEIPMKEVKSATLILGNYVREYNKEAEDYHAMYLTVGKTEAIIKAMEEYHAQFTTQRQVTFEEIKAEANRLFPIQEVLSCKPLNYLQEGKWLGFVKCGIWYREQIKTK